MVHIKRGDDGSCLCGIATAEEMVSQAVVCGSYWIALTRAMLLLVQKACKAISIVIECLH